MESLSTYYHGSNRLFKSFVLDFAGQGTGVKFGYGVYLTSRYASAAHYAKPRKFDQPSDYYVYTVEVPGPTLSNCLKLDAAPSPSLVARASESIGEELPSEVTVKSKCLRKYIGNLLSTRRLVNNGCNVERKSVRQMMSKASLEAEKAASQFFLGIGISYYLWPVNWKCAESGNNIAVLNPNMISIVKVEKVKLDSRHYHLITGSQREISLL